MRLRRGAWTVVMVTVSSLALGAVPAARGLSGVARPAPNTTITSHPPRHTTSRSATFRFKSSQSGSHFVCYLIGPKGKVERSNMHCTSPVHYKHLAAGKHEFIVAAKRDRQTDPTPAGWTWTISKS